MYPVNVYAIIKATRCEVIAMDRTEKAIFTNMCMIFDGNGNVLIQDRVKPDWPGIAFPGGHVEKGESFTDAMIREIFEETGLCVSGLQMCGIQDWTRDDGARHIIFLYKTNQFEGELSSSDEGEVWWASLSELPHMNLASSMQTMLKLFCDDTITEQFFYKENGEWIEVLK